MQIRASALVETEEAMILYLVRSITRITKQKVESYDILAKYLPGHWFRVCIVSGGKVSGWSDQTCIKLRSRFSELWVLLRPAVLIGWVSGAVVWFLRNFSNVHKRLRAALSIALIIAMVVLISSHNSSGGLTTNKTKSLSADSLVTQTLENGYGVSPQASEMSQNKSVAVTNSTETHNQLSSSVSGDNRLRVRVIGNFDNYEYGHTNANTRGVVVAIVDSGIEADQSDLDSLVIAGVDFTDSGIPQDVYHHGKYVAAIIANAGSDENNGNLLPWCRLLDVKVADDIGGCTAVAVANGIVWAVDKGANIINLSLEVREPSLILEEAVNYAWNKGLVLVAAAGNGGGESPVYPAYYEPCLAVAEIQQDGKLAPLSNYGDWVDLAAPVYHASSDHSDNSCVCKTGTSFSCAYVSRVAALLFSVASDLNCDGRVNDEVKEIIESSCRQVLLPRRTQLETYSLASQ